LGAGEREIPPAAAGADLIPLHNGRNYRPTDADQVGEGSLKEKFRQNITAIELLRQIEAEHRAATALEKAVLVRYVGWGGLPQAFAEPKEAPKWQAEQTELRQLLTPDEFSAARAIDAQRTLYVADRDSRDVCRRLSDSGFAAAGSWSLRAVSDTSSGSCRNPCTASSQLTGVELDSLTARLARTLYPDA
jgi:hypothetical protein